jgi:hypothetical protein
MWNQHQEASGVIHRIIRWLVDPEGFAAAAAGNGEPTPLLAVEAYRRVQRDMSRHAKRARRARPDARGRHAR